MRVPPGSILRPLMLNFVPMQMTLLMHTTNAKLYICIRQFCCNNNIANICHITIIIIIGEICMKDPSHPFNLVIYCVADSSVSKKKNPLRLGVQRERKKEKGDRVNLHSQRPEYVALLRRDSTNLIPARSGFQSDMK